MELAVDVRARPARNRATRLRPRLTVRQSLLRAFCRFSSSISRRVVRRPAPSPPRGPPPRSRQRERPSTSSRCLIRSTWRDVRGGRRAGAPAVFAPMPSSGNPPLHDRARTYRTAPFAVTQTLPALNSARSESRPATRRLGHQERKSIATGCRLAYTPECPRSTFPAAIGGPATRRPIRTM